MIQIPKTLCSSCDPPYVPFKVQEIPIHIEECVCEEIPEPFIPEPIVTFTLCPCPVKEQPDSYLPVNPIRTRRTKTCFVEFLKNVTSTKFCDKGPTCVPT